MRAKALASVMALTNLTPKQRDQHSHWRYAEDYNRLLQAAKGVAPHVSHDFWPLEIQKTTGSKLPLARFVELETYARQIFKALPQGLAQP